MVGGSGPTHENSNVLFLEETQSPKDKICTWNREEFGNIFEDKNRMISEIELINKKGMDGRWDDNMNLKEKYLLGQLEARER